MGQWLCYIHYTMGQKMLLCKGGQINLEGTVHVKAAFSILTRQKSKCIGIKLHIIITYGREIDEVWSWGDQSYDNHFLELPDIHSANHHPFWVKGCELKY